MAVTKSSDNWFDMPAGCYCGLFIKEQAAKKLQKLLWRQTQEIKEFLTAHKEDCCVSHWTLAYPEPDKKQTTVYYTETQSEDTVESRIKLFDKSERLRHIDGGIFVSDKMYNEAGEEVQKFYEEMYGEEFADGKRNAD